MPIIFIQSELRKIQDRFNQTFGKMTVCNIKTRQQVMLAIVGMGLLERRINTHRNRNDIKKFMQKRTTLNQIFNTIERSNYVEHANQTETFRNTKAV